MITALPVDKYDMFLLHRSRCVPSLVHVPDPQM